MKRRAIAAAVLSLLLPACAKSPDSPAIEPEPDSGTLIVHIFWDRDHGSAGKRVELLETGAGAFTDSTGHAEFVLPAGDYTVRAYDIGTPGPPPPSVDRSIRVRSNDTTRLEIFDCVYCR